MIAIKKCWKKLSVYSKLKIKRNQLSHDILLFFYFIIFRANFF